VAAEAETAQAREVVEAELELAQRLTAGEASAHARLWDRFGAGLHAYASARLGGDGALADDIVVQTLAAAAQGIGRFNPRRATLSAWVYGIARRQLVGELRRQRRRKSVPLSAQVPLDDVSEAASADDPATEVAARLDAQREVAALAAALSEAEMEALTLYYGHDFSEREIARIMGRSERAVHSLLHRARQKARERLVRDAD
jgi:RNA polymerase sigma-70 factor (ECF subfamily)